MYSKDDSSIANERLIFESRPNLFFSCKKVFILLILLGVIFYFSRSVIAYVGDIQVYLIEYIDLPLTTYVTLFILFLILFIVLWVIWVLLIWRSKEYIITNFRIILKNGVLNKNRYYMPFNHIQDITVSKDLFGRLLSVGTVTVFSAYDGSDIKFIDVNNPDDIEKMIFNEIKLDYTHVDYDFNEDNSDSTRMTDSYFNRGHENSYNDSRLNNNYNQRQNQYNRQNDYSNHDSGFNQNYNYQNNNRKNQKPYYNDNNVFQDNERQDSIGYYYNEKTKSYERRKHPNFIKQQNNDKNSYDSDYFNQTMDGTRRNLDRNAKFRKNNVNKNFDNVNLDKNPNDKFKNNNQLENRQFRDNHNYQNKEENYNSLFNKHNKKNLNSKNYKDRKNQNVNRMDNQDDKELNIVERYFKKFKK